jgi:hypothetical protein
VTARETPRLAGASETVMRFLTLLVCLPALAAAQTSPDAGEIMRRALAQDSQATAAALNYTYLEHQEVRTLDGGKTKVRETNTYDVTLLEGSPYRRLVAHNDQPLSPKDQSKEEEKLRRSIEDRRHETPEQKQQRIADWHRKEEKQHEPLHEIPDAFFLRLAPPESLDGHDVYVIDATPKTGYKPKSKNAFFLPKVKARFWIARQDYQCIRAEFETLDTISWGGFVARVGKGTHLRIELTRVNDEVWLPKRILLTGTARILLVKGYTGEIDLTYSAFKRFTADSRVVSMKP